MRKSEEKNPCKARKYIELFSAKNQFLIAYIEKFKRLIEILFCFPGAAASVRFTSTGAWRP